MSTDTGAPGNVNLQELKDALDVVDPLEVMRRYRELMIPRLRAAGPAMSRETPYHHPNGFAILPLPGHLVGREARGPRFRLHVWLDSKVAEEDAHSHAWSFASRVIGGALSYEIYVECAPEESDIVRRKFKFKLGSTGLTADDEIRIVGLRPVALGVMTAGSFYTLRSDVIHAARRTYPEGACTMICLGQYERDHSVVYIDSGKRDVSVRVDKVPLTARELDAAVQVAFDGARALAAGGSVAGR